MTEAFGNQCLQKMGNTGIECSWVDSYKQRAQERLEGMPWGRVERGEPPTDHKVMEYTVSDEHGSLLSSVFKASDLPPQGSRTTIRHLF